MYQPILHLSVRTAAGAVFKNLLNLVFDVNLCNSIVG